jgi:hypothetical protein
MNLDQLAERMGGDATNAQAKHMRETLAGIGLWSNTEDIPEDQWLKMLDGAVAQAKHNVRRKRVTVNPARTRASKRETAKNPLPEKIRRLGYAVVIDQAGTDQMLGVFNQLSDAKPFARAVADSLNRPARIVSGAYVFTPSS